jgi:hypothetical protein
MNNIIHITKEFTSLIKKNFSKKYIEILLSFFKQYFSQEEYQPKEILLTSLSDPEMTQQEDDDIYYEQRKKSKR